ncbi:MAG: hypothetical protein SGI71_02565 [Verrucomicrobiota bacterium]|nr:hypothetical protein [Verrucomicrobiota bacterium]
MNDDKYLKAAELKVNEKVDPMLPVLGLESEFTLLVNGEKKTPEEVFGKPKALLADPMIPRAGRSQHLESGGALYFDTGVVEVATPIIELNQDCSEQVTRSLWEQIHFLRHQLDLQESLKRCRFDLEGFSAHYNVSAKAKKEAGGSPALAWLLVHILPVPIALLATNRKSTGVGIRPRPGRIELTADFTPDIPLMTATTAFFCGVVNEVLSWENYGIEEMTRRGLPVIEGFLPKKHTSRKGWLAHIDCFPKNLFESNVTEDKWTLQDGSTATCRDMGQRLFDVFRPSISKYCCASTLEHIKAIMHGCARSFLDFDDRPLSYGDVGRSVNWSRRTFHKLARSQYEQIIHSVIDREEMHVGGERLRACRIISWYDIEFKNIENNRKRQFNLDQLIQMTA